MGHQEPEPPQQIAWPAPGAYRTPDGKKPAQKYVSAPVDAHIDAVSERARIEDVKTAREVLVPAIRQLAVELHRNEVHEEEIARVTAQFAPYVRRRLLALWRAHRAELVNCAEGYWALPEEKA